MKPVSAVISIIVAFLLGLTCRDLLGIAPAPTVTAEPTAPPRPPGAAPARAVTPASAPTPEAPLSRAPQQDSDRIPVGNSPALGPAFAPVTIVEFSDFECPFCGGVEATLRDLRRRYGDRLRVVWKNNPLDMHPSAVPAAEAAQEALAQGGPEKFWAMHDLLFANQSALDRPALERYAQQLRLDLPRFRAALDNHTHREAIEADKALLQRLGGRGTPNFYVNGANLRGQQPVETFITAIDAALARARGAAPGRAYAEGVTAALAPPPTAARSPDDPNAAFRVPVGNSPVLGPATALVTVAIFSDFQCPFCARAEPTLRALRTRYGADIRFVWKNEPLTIHPLARPAAQLAHEALAQRGAAGFWRAHDLLFEHNTELERPALEGYARTLGLDLARVRAAIDGNRHDAQINADHQLAQELGVSGTPAFFINGRRLVGARPEEAFAEVIDAAKREAEELIRTLPGTTRANVYDRLMERALPPPRAPGGAADPDRVYSVRPAPNAPSRGGANARVVIEHFSDFECPFCARVEPTLAQVRQRYGDRVRFVWRNFPLRIHEHAQLAAEAAMEVYAQRGNAGFWAFHDTLFANQSALDRQALERYAQAAGVDMTRFRAALDNRTRRAAVQDDMAAGQSTGASLAMPSFFVNGRFFAGALPLEEFTRRIDAALAAAR
jgi:protein-disulfide isomerase